MLKSLTAADVANEISMSRANCKDTYVLVEGATDARLYGKFIADGVRIKTSGSKSNVKYALKLLRERGEKSIVGIVDRDLDSMLNIGAKPPLFETDRHDMESTLICSGALDGVLAEYADKERLERFESACGDVRTVVGKAACPICILMYISYRRGMNLSFKDLPHRDFINKRNLSIDARMMINAVYSQSMVQMYSESAALDLVKEQAKAIKDPWDAVRGHDAVAILTIGLRDAFGAFNAKNLTENAVSGSLRLAYSSEMFSTTELYAKTAEYAKQNGIALWNVTQAR